MARDLAIRTTLLVISRNCFNNDEVNRLVKRPHELVATLAHVCRMHRTPKRWPLKDKGGWLWITVDG